jgi:regulation of enolase protein 1 (concanavalin A-like superfamily)
MRRKIIYLFSVVLVLNFVSLTYGIGIGDFENDMDGWSVYDDPNSPTDPNALVSYSMDGATLGSYSLRIEAITGFQRTLEFDLIANNMVDEFRKNLKILADVTRLTYEWVDLGGSWCEITLEINAGSTVAGQEWDSWIGTAATTNWAPASGDEPMNIIYNYSLAHNQIDYNNLEYLRFVFTTNWGGYDPGGTYYLDNVQLFGSGAAYDPDPEDGGRDTPIVTTLNWTSGVYASTHNVYFGTKFNDVNDASETNDPNGVLVSQNQDANSFNPDELEYGKTYFWRIDEVNDAHPDKMWKGDVWTFTTAYREGGYVLGDWEDSLDNWVKFPDTAKYITLGYSTTGATLNDKSLKVDIVAGQEAYWIIRLYLSPAQLEALKANDLFAFDVTWVASEWQGHSYSVIAKIAINSDATGWSEIERPASDTSNPDDTGVWNPTFGPINTRTVTYDYSGINVASIEPGGWTQINIAQTHDPSIGAVTYYFDNVRFLNSGIPTKPHPADRQTDVQTEPTLSWTPGKYAETHDVYFGSNFDDVNEAGAGSYPNVTYVNIDVNNFKPGNLEFNTTYYWRVDEVSITQPDKFRRGKVWSFTTGNFVVVDDFEDYNDISNRIYDTWLDYYVNNTGMTVGHLDPPFAEKRIVHGDYQSMYMRYDNDGTVNEGTDYEQSGTLTFSEAERQWAEPQDWTAEGAESLTLWFRGVSASVGSFRAVGPIYMMTAGGADIWGTSDQFHFAYKQFSGVGSITAKVVSVSNTDPWAKAGLMMRETLAADARHVMVAVTPSSGVSLQDRPVPGENSEELTVADVTAPQWLRLTRSVNTFTAEYSSNGSNWQTVGSVTMPMLIDVYIGLCLTSHNADAMCTANFSNVAIDGTVTGDWQSQDIGIESNIAEPIYVVVEDSTGSSALVEYPDPAASTIKRWTEWNIPFSDLAGVNPQAIRKMIIGVGDRTSTQPGSEGSMYIDDIRLYLPEP